MPPPGMSAVLRQCKWAWAAVGRSSPCMILQGSAEMGSRVECCFNLRHVEPRSWISGASEGSACQQQMVSGPGQLLLLFSGGLGVCRLQREGCCVALGQHSGPACAELVRLSSMAPWEGPWQGPARLARGLITPLKSGFYETV